MGSLEELLSSAEKAGTSRIEFRDRIAAHGAPAVEAMAPWVRDPQLGAFAVRVIGRAAGHDARAEAIAALAEAARAGATPDIRRDAEEQLRTLGATRALAAGPECEILETGSRDDGRPFVRFVTRAQGESGHFTVGVAVVEALGLPTDARVELDILARDVHWRGVIDLRSGNEAYPRLKDQETRGLERIRPYERIEVTVTPAR